MAKRRFLSIFFLLSAAIIWGFAFLAQDKAGEITGTFTINGIRFIIGGLFLIPVIAIFRKVKGRKILETTKEDRKSLIIASIICGVALAVAANVQQFGINIYPDEAATSGRSGFITALYIVIVPIFSFFVFKKRISLNVVIGIILAVIGLYLLCLSNGITEIYTGDFIILICSFCFAIQILCIDKFANSVDMLKLSSIQFFVVGMLSLILAFIFERPTIENIMPVWYYILFLGIFSSGIAYTFQALGQQYSDNPTVASILMSGESLFAALFGAIFANERFTPRELIGCIVMFIAIIISQLPSIKSKKRQK